MNRSKLKTKFLKEKELKVKKIWEALHDLAAFVQF